MNQHDRFARISLQLHGEETISLNLVRCDSSPVCAPYIKLTNLSAYFSQDRLIVNAFPEPMFSIVSAISRCLFEFGDYNYRVMEMRAHICHSNRGSTVELNYSTV